MVWEPEVEELRRRAALAARGGAPNELSASTVWAG